MRVLRATVVLWLCVCGVGFAGDQDGTIESLGGTRVADQVAISLDDTGATPSDFFLRYRTDGEALARQLGPARSFLASNEIRLVLEDFNPLRMRVSTERKEFDDAAFLAMKEFLGALKAFAVAGGAPAKAASEAKSQPEPAPDKSSKDKALRSVQTGVKDAVDACPGPTNDLLAALAILDRAYQPDPESWRGEILRSLAGFQQGAGLAQLREARAGIRKWADKTDSRLALLKTAAADLAAIGRTPVEGQGSTDVAGTRPGSGSGITLSEARRCHAELARATALAFAASADYAASVDALMEMQRNLQQLDTALEAFDRAGLWAGSSLIFDRYTPNDEKGCSLTVTVTGVKLDPDTAEPVDDWTASSTLRLRHFQALVPEIGAGFFYSPLEIPSYGTKESEGATVVADAGTDTLDGGAAVFLNLVWRWKASTLVYPMAQLGVGTGADTPSLAAGVGLRFTKLGGVSLSAGVVTTWFQDLDALHVGDQVEGTAALQKDLRRRNRSDWYVAVLYNWTLGTH